MNTLNNQTDNNKWFDVSFVDAKGGKRSCWTNRDDLKLDFSESFYQRSSKYHTPITPLSVVSIDSVNQVTPGDVNIFSKNITSIQNLVDTLLEDCGLDKITWLHETEEDTEQYKADTLFNILIDLCNSCKDEIRKQLDYLEVSARNKLRNEL